MVLVRAAGLDAASEVFGELFVANTLFTGSACLVLAWVSWQGYRQHGTPFLRLWAVGWLCYCAARAITLLQVGPWPRAQAGSVQGALLSTASQTFYYAHVALLLGGALQLAGIRVWRPTWRGGVLLFSGIAAFAGVVAFATAHAPDLRPAFRVGLRCAVTAGVFVACGALLLRHGRRTSRLGARLVGGALFGGAVLFLLHAYGFTFGTWIGLLSYLGAFEVLVLCSIGLGLVLWAQEDATAAAQMTNQRLAERTQALLQAQRMESIGHLASGIAHDFNNVLTVVLGNTDLLLRSGEMPPSARGTLAETRTAATHAGKIIAQMLSLARNSAGAPRVIDAASEIRELATLLHNLAGPGVRVTFDLAGEPLRVRLLPGHLGQILINLVANARDALTAGGTVTIAARREAFEEGARVVVATIDSGRGMPAAVRSRVGELFFTTKGQHGTGMGMASVRSILADTGGRMQIDSVEGVGTTVTVSWPEAAAGGADAPATATAAGRPDRTPTILVAHGDAGLRNLTRRTLTGSGYCVLAATDPSAATQHAGRIDLLLTDVVLAPGQGPQPVADLAQARPEMRVGYLSAGPAGATAALPAGTPVLAAPFTSADLLQFVEAVLAADPQDARRSERS